jgi:hypothetical protein
MCIRFVTSSRHHLKKIEAGFLVLHLLKSVDKSCCSFSKRHGSIVMTELVPQCRSAGNGDRSSLSVACLKNWHPSYLLFLKSAAVFSFTDEGRLFVQNLAADTGGRTPAMVLSTPVLCGQGGSLQTQ